MNFDSSEYLAGCEAFEGNAAKSISMAQLVAGIFNSSEFQDDFIFGYLVAHDGYVERQMAQ